MRRVMELNIPGIHGPGGSHIYFVDRYREFSIYDVDFTLIPTVDPKPPAITGLHFFGVVQHIGRDRTEEWLEFYRELFNFSALPDEQRFGILRDFEGLDAHLHAYKVDIAKSMIEMCAALGCKVLLASCCALTAHSGDGYRVSSCMLQA